MPAKPKKDGAVAAQRAEASSRRNLPPKRTARVPSGAKQATRRLDRKRLEVLDLLRIQRDLGLALSTISTIQPALQAVLGAAMSVEGIDAGGVYLVDHAAHSVELVAHRGLSAPFIRTVSRYDVVAPLASRVMSGLPVYRNYEQVQANPLFVNEGFLSVAGFPIHYSRDVIAVMNLASRSCRTIPRFTRTVLAAIAEQIGVVIPRIRAETEWREADTNLHSLFDTTGDLLFILNERGCILDVNQAVPALLGYTRKQLLGKGISKVHPPWMRDDVNAILAGMLAGNTTECHVPLITRSGDQIPVETRITRGRWNGEQVFFGICRDIRERKQLEQEIVRINESERFRIAQDVHDNLMQQLAGIALLSASLKQQIAEKDSAARKTADHIIMVSRDVLAASRRTVQGLAPIAPIEGGMKLALQRLARNTADTFGCDCRAHCLIEAGPLTSAVSTQLYYIAQEAVQNACKHGKADKIDVELTVRAEHGTLDITDNGTGLKQDSKMQPGLGLRIMVHRANLIGGHLSVSPWKRGGTRVRCVFRPMADPAP